MGKQASEVKGDLLVVRVSAEQKAEISKRATKAGFKSMSEYVIRCALGTMDRGTLEERVDQLERLVDERMSVLERAVELGGFG